MNAPKLSFELPAAAKLELRVQQALDAARRTGASQAEASVTVNRGLSVSVRKAEVESLRKRSERQNLCRYEVFRAGCSRTKLQCAF